LVDYGRARPGRAWLLSFRALRQWPRSTCEPFPSTLLRKKCSQKTRWLLQWWVDFQKLIEQEFYFNGIWFKKNKDAVVYYRVFNPAVSVANVENAQESTRLLAQTSLRNVLGQKSLSEILQDRESVSRAMRECLDEATDPWVRFFFFSKLSKKLWIIILYLFFQTGNRSGAGWVQRCKITRTNAACYGHWGRSDSRSQS
jgi:hypothetical protein